MKVCTDSCLFGALIVAKSAKRALDIGSGTGLLSLMVAQRFPDLTIDAVEIDSGAAGDAKENIAQSPFHKNINLLHQDIQQYQTNEKYDIIFSNPPFYENHLKSPKAGKNIAHHSSRLNLSDLSHDITRLLKQDGSVWIMLPPQSMGLLEARLQKTDLYPKMIYKIRHNENKPIFREIIEFSKGFEPDPVRTDISIFEKDNYSAIFTAYLKDYYLIF